MIFEEKYKDNKKWNKENLKEVKVIHKIEVMWITSVDKVIITLIIEKSIKLNFKNRDISVDNFPKIQKINKKCG